MATCYVCGKNDLSKDEIGLTKKLIDKLRDSSHSLINLYYGADVTEETAAALQAARCTTTRCLRLSTGTMSRARALLSI